MLQTQTLQLPLEGLDLVLDVVANTDELYEHLLAKPTDHIDVQDERIPYWADLWPSAIALSRFLITSGISWKDQKVTEIGCGLGLPGMVAAKLGAEVTMTDYLQEPLLLLDRNWRKNVAAPPQLRIMDWRTPDPGLAANVLLASDIAYEKRFFDWLPQTLRTLMAPGGIALVAEPGRPIAVPFFESLPLLGFQVEKTILPGRFMERNYAVNIFKIYIA